MKLFWILICLANISCGEVGEGDDGVPDTIEEADGDVDASTEASWDDSGPDIEEDAVETSPDSSDPDDSGPDIEDVVETSPDVGPDDSGPDDSGPDSEDVVEVSPDVGPDDVETSPDASDSDAEDVPEAGEVAPPPTPCGYFALRWDDFEDVVLDSTAPGWGAWGSVDGGPFDDWVVLSQDRGGAMSQVAYDPHMFVVIRWDRYLSSPTDLWAVSFWVRFTPAAPGRVCTDGVCATLLHGLSFNDDGCVRSRWDPRPCPTTWTPGEWIHVVYRESECAGFTVDGDHVDGPTSALCRTMTEGYIEVNLSGGWVAFFDDACMARHLP